MSHSSKATKVLARSALAATAIGVLPLSAHAGARPASSPVNVIYTYPTFSGVPKDLQQVQNALNTYLTKKINATITLNPLAGGVYDQKMKLGFAAGQPCDLVFTAPWINNYYQLVTNGDLLPLDDLLKADAPRTYASMPASTWNAARVNGKIYAIINQQLFPKYFGIQFRRDLATKYHINVNTLHSYDDVTPILATLKAHEPAITPMISDSQLRGALYSAEVNGVDPLVQTVGTGTVAGVSMTDRALTIVDPAQTAAYKHAVELNRTWYLARYYLQDAPQPDDALARFKAGRFAAVVDQQRPGRFEEAKLKATYGWDTVGVSFAKPVLTTAGTVATLTGVCRSSAHPDAAMKVAELFNTDKTAYNLITHGIEGQDYVFVDRAHNVIGLPSGKTETTDGYYPNTDWMFGNQFNALYTDKGQIGDYVVQAKAQAGATASVALGFAADTTPIKTQLAQINAVYSQYGAPLEKGLVDPAVGLPRYLSALKAAGEDQVLAEVQKQINRWAKANHK